MHNNKKKSLWKEVDTLMDPGSQLGIVILRMPGNPPKYTFQIIQFTDERKLYKVPFQAEADGEPKLEDVVFSLVQAARLRVEEETKKDAERKAKKPRREAPRPAEGGLSQLAKKDATAKGHDFVGKTARKKQARA